MTTLTLNMKNDQNKDSDKIPIKFFCQYCNKLHRIKVNKEIFEDCHFPISYIYIHSEPQIVTTLYIDKNFTVRGVEYPKGLSLNQNELEEILGKTKVFVLNDIPQDLIYGFQLMEDKKVLKIYNKIGFEKTFNYALIRRLLKLSSKFVKNKEGCSEFFLKYSDYWISGLEMFNYSFFMIADHSIDIGHLKTQVMGIFETIIT